MVKCWLPILSIRPLNSLRHDFFFHDFFIDVQKSGETMASVQQKFDAVLESEVNII